MAKERSPIQKTGQPPKGNYKCELCLLKEGVRVDGYKYCDQATMEEHNKRFAALNSINFNSSVAGTIEGDPVYYNPGKED